MIIPPLPDWLRLRSLLFFEGSVHMRAFLRDDYGYLVSAFGAGATIEEAAKECEKDGLRLKPRPERKPFRTLRTGSVIYSALENLELDL